MRNRRPAAVASILLLLAVVVRIPAVTTADASFIPTRQYRGALIARDIAFDLYGAPSPDRAAHADAVAADRGMLEPPLVEALAGVLDVDEPGDIWRIRVLLAGAYLLGVGLLAWSLRPWVGDRGALAGFAVGALSPFLIVLSTSFQPEPVVLSLGFVAVANLLRHAADRRRRSLDVATGALAVAGLLKPTVLPVVGVPILVAAWPAGRLRAVARTAVAGAPAVAWLVAGTVVGDFLAGQSSMSFQPEVLATPEFWRGWWTQIGLSVGVMAVGVTAIAIAVADRRLRSLLGGATVGFVISSLVFAYHFSTHVYYPAVAAPVVVVAVAAFVAWIDRHVTLRLVWAAGLGAVAVMLAVDGFERGRALDDRNTEVAEVARDVIGSDRVIVVGDDYGASLAYLAGARTEPWPTPADRAISDLPAPDAVLRTSGARWVVIEPGHEQADVVALLRHHPVAVCSDDGIVVDLDAGGALHLDTCIRRLARDRAATT